MDPQVILRSRQIIQTDTEIVQNSAMSDDVFVVWQEMDRGS